MFPSWSCSQAISKPVWHIPLLCVQWKTPDNGQRNCPKHAEFRSKNKFEKLVHLVGFVIRKDSFYQVGHLSIEVLLWGSSGSVIMGWNGQKWTVTAISTYLQRYFGNNQKDHRTNATSKWWLERTVTRALPKYIRNDTEREREKCLFKDVNC